MFLPKIIKIGQYLL